MGSSDNGRLSERYWGEFSTAWKAATCDGRPCTYACPWLPDHGVQLPRASTCTTSCRPPGLPPPSRPYGDVAVAAMASAPGGTTPTANVRPPPSTRQRKREAHAVQALGAQLVALSLD